MSSIFRGLLRSKDLNHLYNSINQPLERILRELNLDFKGETQSKKIFLFREDLILNTNL